MCRIHDERQNTSKFQKFVSFLAMDTLLPSRVRNIKLLVNVTL